jgi:hypothetical protein
MPFFAAIAAATVAHLDRLVLVLMVAVIWFLMTHHGFPHCRLI